MAPGTERSPLRLKIANLPRNGKELTFNFDEKQRKAIAEELDILALDALDVHVSAWPWGRGGLKLSGDLRASLVQRCVVTFKPVGEDLAERFVRTYLPQQELDSLQRKLGLSESVEFDVDSDDPPEPLNSDHIDLRAIIVEELTLALNPYPRHKDAEATDLSGESTVLARPSPFDVLKKLTGGDDA